MVQIRNNNPIPALRLHHLFWSKKRETIIDVYMDTYSRKYHDPPQHSPTNHQNEPFDIGPILPVISQISVHIMMIFGVPGERRAACDVSWPDQPQSLS